MKLFKFFTISLLAAILFSCNGTNSSTQKNMGIAFINKKTDYQLGQTAQIEVSNPKNLEITGINFKLNGNPITINNNQLPLNNLRLGSHQLSAEVQYGEKTEMHSLKFTLYNNVSPKVYSYRVLNEYAHNPEWFTQGLEFYKDTLYEGTGQKGESALRKVDYKTGKVYQETKLDNQYFGEGITVLNDTVYQLTWQSNIGFVYNTNTLKRVKTFPYGESREGWGLCNNGKKLFKSDGSEKIWTLNPETQKEEGYIEVYTNKSKLLKINELEFANGKIYANTWQFNKEVGIIINPENGAVEGVIDFSGLKDKVAKHPELDVLNGIAYNPKTNTFFVTGKNWNKLFEVEIVEKN